MRILQKNYTMTDRSYGMYLAYFTLAALGFNALLAVYLGFGFGSALAGLLIAVTPFLFTRYTKIKFPWFVYFLICLAVLIHISGYIQGRYLNIPNWDTLAHTVSGSIIALLGFILILFLDKIRKYNLDPQFIAGFTIMFGLTGEYLWEIYEFLVDTFLGGSLAGKMQADNTDTMVDMIFVLVPSIIVAVGCYYYLHKNGKEKIMHEMTKDSTFFSP
jgi:mannose/fructose/N-acetylgalactosamine-specific phosphotransferase system component IIC